MKDKKSRRGWRQQDPHYEREMKKYGRATPSREYILQYLTQQGAPRSREEMAEAWELREDWELESLGFRLKAMSRDGQIIQNRRRGYGVVAKMDLIKGRVIGHPEGYGFLVPEEGGDDLFISARRMRELMHGDRAVMRVAGIDRRGRREGALVEVLDRNTSKIVGRYFADKGVGFVEPDNRRISQDIMVPPDMRGGAKAGQIVIAEIVEQPSKHARPVAKITEILGDHMAPGMEVQIAIFSHNIPAEWPEGVVEQADAFPSKVPAAAAKGRLDLRNTPLVTIDGITARDFDDAVYCEKRGKNWRLIVAIADVSNYVDIDTPLDREAANRGNSVYFPDQVIPMLPESLSNGLCSLNPQVDRLCMVCDMTIGPNGRIVRSKFAEAIMRSAARLTYEAVAQMVVEKDERLRSEHAHLMPHLDNLYALYGVLRSAREIRGAIDFDTPETVIEYGADKKIERIAATERNDAHKLIEECMIIANVAAARFLQRHKMPALYRVHEGPKQQKLEKLRGFLGELGLGLGGGDDPSPKDYAKLMERASDRPDLHLIQTVMLRSLSQAIYSPDNKGHFGLAHEAYAHFTSPIRRFPDLLVHRAIRHVLRGGKPREFGYNHESMVSLGEHSSMTDRRADEATRDAAEWLKCEFMMDKVNESFDAIVSSVTSFGLFVQLESIFVEGLVHITALPSDYYHFDPVGHRLRGERAGKVYRLGDPVHVKLIRVDLDERKIDFEIEEKKPKTKSKKAPAKKRRKPKKSD